MKGENKMKGKIKMENMEKNENRKRDLIKDYNSSNSFNLWVENVLTLDCSSNLFSLDQIEMPSLRASAKYGVSFRCSGNNFSASGRNFSYSDLGTIFMTSHKSIKEVTNSSSFISQNSQILSLSDKSSFNKKSGANNLIPLLYNDLKKLLVNDSDLKKENKIAASITSSIFEFQSPCLLATLSFNSSANSLACSSVSLLFFNILSTTLNNNNALIFSSTASLNNACASGVSSSSPAILAILSGIFILNSSINKNNDNNYLKLSESNSQSNIELNFCGLPPSQSGGGAMRFLYLQ